MSLPDPPYTYDDPRLLYDEVCFFYDGGYDLVCLAGPVIVGKGGGSSDSGKKRVEEPKKNFVNIFIEHKLISVNGVPYHPDEDPEWFRFVGENDQIDIVIDGVKIDITKPMVEGKFLEAVKRIMNYSGSFESKAEVLENVIVSSSFYITTKSMEPPVVLERVLEPYSDYRIDCELIVEKVPGSDADKDDE